MTNRKTLLSQIVNRRLSRQSALVIQVLSIGSSLYVFLGPYVR